MKLQNHRLKDIRNQVPFRFQEPRQNICTTNKGENRFQHHDDQGKKKIQKIENFDDFSSANLKEFWEFWIMDYLYRFERRYSDEKRILNLKVGSWCHSIGFIDKRNQLFDMLTFSKTVKIACTFFWHGDQTEFEFEFVHGSADGPIMRTSTVFTNV